MTALRQIHPPPEARDASRLPSIDYADAFLLETSAPGTAEELARAVLDGAPLAARSTLLSGWVALGLRAGESESSILSWPIRTNTPDLVLLARESRIGMPAELLFARRPGALLFCTFVHHGTPAARALWASVEPVHVPIVRRLLAAARARL